MENEERLLGKNYNKSLSQAETHRSITELKVREDKSDKNTRNINKQMNENLVRIELERDNKILQWGKLKYMVYSYIAVIIITFLRGTESFKSLIGVDQ